MDIYAFLNITVTSDTVMKIHIVKKICIVTFCEYGKVPY